MMFKFKVWNGFEPETHIIFANQLSDAIQSIPDQTKIINVEVMGQVDRDDRSRYE